MMWLMINRGPVAHFCLGKSAKLLLTKANRAMYVGRCIRQINTAQKYCNRFFMLIGLAKQITQVRQENWIIRAQFYGIAI